MAALYGGVTARLAAIDLTTDGGRNTVGTRLDVDIEKEGTTKGGLGRVPRVANIAGTVKDKKKKLTWAEKVLEVAMEIRSAVECHRSCYFGGKVRR